MEGGAVVARRLKQVTWDNPGGAGMEAVTTIMLQPHFVQVVSSHLF